jgi:predicted negative regulator of RcsB-dependent stress response
MSKNLKTIIVLVIIAVIIVLVWSAFGTSSTNAPVNNPTLSGGQYDLLTTSASDASNAALQKDIATVESQLNGLDSDITNTNVQ